MTHRIVLLPGDGIGPEVVDAALTVLRAAAARFDLLFAFDVYPVGAAALRAGLPPLPPETERAALASDAVFLGAVGSPEFDKSPRSERPETGLLQLRRSLGVYANLRPAKVWPGLGVRGPFVPDHVRGLDLLIVRELLGGLYFGEPRSFDWGEGTAVNTLRYSRDEVQRVARVAFGLARSRGRRLTSVDKANVLETSLLWRHVVDDVAAEFPDVEHDHMLVDACAMSLVLEPRRFDVLLTENLFGDILSDEAGALVGSLGLLPSASLGDGPALYEPVHGSAPALAGRDVANPVGAMASAAMLLRHTLGHHEAADAVEAAIGAQIESGGVTMDLAAPGVEPLGCQAFAAAVAEKVGSGLR